jgi:hypothetical protein
LKIVVAFKFYDHLSGGRKMTSSLENFSRGFKEFQEVEYLGKEMSFCSCSGWRAQSGVKSLEGQGMAHGRLHCSHSLGLLGQLLDLFH